MKREYCGNGRNADNDLMESFGVPGLRLGKVLEL